MERPKSPLQTLVDSDYQDILGTLTNKGWSSFQEAIAEAEFFHLDGSDNEVDVNIVDALWRSVRMTSAQGGEHRRDVVQGMQGQKAPTMAMAVPVQANGHLDAGSNGKGNVTVRPRL